MGIFDKLFNSEEGRVKEEDIFPWKELIALDQLDEIIEASKIKPQVIFKHSTRCGISRMVIRDFEKKSTLSGDQIDLYYLDLLKYRAISNEISSKLRVYHESPQLIVIKNENMVHHSSHGAITVEVLHQFL